MRFTVDVGELAVVPGLDTEPAEVDLTRDGPGDACLDAAVEGMLASHGRSEPGRDTMDAAEGRDGAPEGPRPHRFPPPNHRPQIPTPFPLHLLPGRSDRVGAGVRGTPEADHDATHE